ncbi:hypothetical protein Tsubulata_004062 [Turnera subulata]|uniref:At1g61320/AtMIF1 LRR domain-containing protein n=1 Tax=Turnera subulata TaxID=218843 RepID=A0A9Q0F8S5_9ROSI|nr:hypothetical protein Tsubulata_004062 [Turnera subulata]
MEAILSNCLLLEELHLACCKELPSLKMVSASLRKLQIRGDGMKAEISAINLIDFDYRGRHSSNIILLDAPRLINIFLFSVAARDVSHALSLCSGKPHLMAPIFNVSLSADPKVDARQRIGTFNSIKLLKLGVYIHDNR